MRNCVTAARQTLTLFVGVQIPIPQPGRSLQAAVFYLLNMAAIINPAEKQPGFGMILKSVTISEVTAAAAMAGSARADVETASAASAAATLLDMAGLGDVSEEEDVVLAVQLNAVVGRVFFGSVSLFHAL